MNNDNVAHGKFELFKKVFSGAYDQQLTKIWYAFIVVLGAVYVVGYRYLIFDLKAINAAHIVAVIWIVILFVPIFSEMEIFGFKFKREIKKIDEQVKEIKTSVLTLQMQSTTNLYNYFPGQLPNNEKDKLKTEVKNKYLVDLRKTLLELTTILCFCFL